MESTHKVSLSNEAEKLIRIGEKIIHQHTSLGASSPLNHAVVAELYQRISNARIKHEEGAKYKRLMEAAWRERDSVMGGDDDKGVWTSLHTIAHELKQHEQDIADWGY